MKRTDGFTLVEMIVTIALVGIVGAILTLQIKPALQSYQSVARRASLVNQADTALRRMVTDVRSAVPNSLNMTPTPAGICMEMVPTVAGGRYRVEPDTTRPDDSRAYDPGATDKVFDVLTALPNAARGDIVVIGNQSTDDLYKSRSNMAPIKEISTPPAGIGVVRLALETSAPFSARDDGARFVVVPQNEQVVGYLCAGGNGRLAGGDGRGTLLRTVRKLTDPGNCPTAGAPAVVASKVADCGFVYRENEGATQQSGYLQLRLGLANGDESVSLTAGAHVENVP